MDDSMDFYEMARWSKKYDLVLNRVSIANQLFGCRYDFSNDNPMTISKEHGSYSVSYLDAEVANFRRNDLDSVDAALHVLDQWSRCLWLLSRSGRLRRESVHT